jgi:peptide/nickel transport system substrate-binding protein
MGDRLDNGQNTPAEENTVNTENTENTAGGVKFSVKKRNITIIAAALAAAGLIAAITALILGGGVRGVSTIYKAATDKSTVIEHMVVGVEGLEGGYRPQDVALPGDRLVSDAIYEPLVAAGPEGLPVNVLAESVTLSPDGLVYTVRLKDGVKFHNGQLLTARDVAASTAALVGRGTRFEPYLAGLDGYEEYIGGAPELAGVVAKGEDAVVFSFTAAKAENVWALGVGVQRAGEIGDYSAVNGTGPYKYGSYSEARRTLTLEPNGDYRGGAPSGGVSLRDMTLSEAVALYKAGEINAFQFNYDEKLLAEAAAIPDINIYQGDGGGYLYLGINCARFDVPLRRALAYALDREAFAAEVFGGGAAAAALPLPEAAFATGGLSKLARYKHSERAALREFKAAGYEKNAAGKMASADGTLLTLTITALDTELARRELNAIAAQLDEYGVQVSQDLIPYKDYRAQIYRDGDYDLYMSTWQGGAYVDMSRFARGSGMNIENWENETAYAALDKIAAAISYEAAAEHYAALLEQYGGDAPQIPLATTKRFLAAHHSIKGLSYSQYSTVFGNLSGVKIG